MRAVAAAIAASLLAAVLTGCVHHTPFTDEYYFQAFGNPSEIVLTADIGKIRESSLSGLIPSGGAAGYLMDRTERLSLSLEPKQLDIYPLPFDSYAVSGALEGNIGKFPVNTALSMSKDFHRVKEDGVRFYTDSTGSFSAAVPENGILLFTDGSYRQLYDRSVVNRVKLIDDETAAVMADSVFALFVNSPETLADLGFDLPDTVIRQIESSYLAFSESDEGALLLSGRMLMDSKSSARALTTILRNQILQDAKRSGGKVDIKVLSSYFNYSEELITIDCFPLPEDMADRAGAIVRNALEGLI